MLCRLNSSLRIRFVMVMILAFTYYKIVTSCDRYMMSDEITLAVRCDVTLHCVRHWLETRNESSIISLMVYCDKAGSSQSCSNVFVQLSTVNKQ